MADVIDATTVVATPANPAPSAAVVNPEDTAAYWRDKYNGQKGYITTLQNEKQALQTKFETATSEKSVVSVESETAINELNRQIAELTSQVGIYKPQVEQLTATNKDLARKQEVGALIRTEYGVLANLYEKGLLTAAIGTLEGEELKTFLASYAAELGTVAQQNHEKEVTTQVVGSTPQPNTQQRGNSSVNVKDLQVKVAQIGNEKGFHSPEYKEQFDLYIQALSQVKPE
jgi:hypothetical protein